MSSLAAPLIATADAPIPQGARAVWFDGARGMKLRAALFAPDGACRGSVVISPGRAEPIEKYFEVAAELQARGFTALVHDWRGQGLSQRLLADRLKGHARGYADFLADYRLMLDALGAQLPQPWIMLGHSMGGGLNLLSLAEGERRFSAGMMSAPMIGLASVRAAPRAAGLIARLAAAMGLAEAYVLREAYDPLGAPFERNVLTHDRRRYERFRGQLQACSDLQLGGVTWGWLDFALRLGARLSRPAAAKGIVLPLTIVDAEDDRLVLNAVNRRLAEDAPQGRYVRIAGAFHEILMETDAVRAAFWQAFDALAAQVAA